MAESAFKLQQKPSQTVDISDCKVVADPEMELVTYSLGSCIGVAIWDPQVHVGGLLHFFLPDSSVAPEKAKRQPAMFADTGMKLLFTSAYELGAVKRRLIVKVAGGAARFEASGQMDIGRNNYASLLEVCKRNNVRIRAEHVGGTMSRTMRLEVGTGRVTVGNRRTGNVEL